MKSPNSNSSKSSESCSPSLNYSKDSEAPRETIFSVDFTTEFETQFDENEKPEIEKDYKLDWMEERLSSKETEMNSVYESVDKGGIKSEEKCGKSKEKEKLKGILRVMKEKWEGIEMEFIRKKKELEELRRFLNRVIKVEENEEEYLRLSVELNKNFVSGLQKRLETKTRNQRRNNKIERIYRNIGQSVNDYCVNTGKLLEKLKNGMMIEYKIIDFTRICEVIANNIEDNYSECREKIFSSLKERIEIENEAKRIYKDTNNEILNPFSVESCYMPIFLKNTLQNYYESVCSANSKIKRIKSMHRHSQRVIQMKTRQIIKASMKLSKLKSLFLFTAV
jgi:hypothetical protein